MPLRVMPTINQRDPTLTTALRMAYSRQMRVRFNAVRKLVITSVVSNDALRLKSGILVFQAEPLTRLTLPSDDVRKISAFVDWLREIMEIEILEGSDVTPGHWQNQFIREAYLRGVKRADGELQKVGLLRDFAPVPLDLPGVLVPVNDAALQVLYLNNFELIKSVTEQSLGRVRQTLVQGILEGVNPRLMARRMVGSLEIGIKDAERIARTEVIRAFNEGALNRYEQFGVEGVTAQVEFATAGDARVCIRCKSLDGTIRRLQDARGLIPLHP